MKLLTSFTKLTTGEGIRVAYTYSEVDEEGKMISQNNRENFIVVDQELRKHIEAVDDYISNKYLAKEGEK